MFTIISVMNNQAVLIYRSIKNDQSIPEVSADGLSATAKEVLAKQTSIPILKQVFKKDPRISLPKLGRYISKTDDINWLITKRYALKGKQKIVSLLKKLDDEKRIIETPYGIHIPLSDYQKYFMKFIRLENSKHDQSNHLSRYASIQILKQRIREDYDRVLRLLIAAQINPDLMKPMVVIDKERVSSDIWKETVAKIDKLAYEDQICHSKIEPVYLKQVARLADIIILADGGFLLAEFRSSVEAILRKDSDSLLIYIVCANKPGIGRAMMLRAIDIGRMQGVKHVVLHALPQVVKYYERFGFVTLRNSKGEKNGNNLRGYFMKKPVNNLVNWKRKSSSGRKRKRG